MRIGRRAFSLGSSVALAACQHPIRSPELPSQIDVISIALDLARRGGASYADVRLVRRKTERIATREDHVVSVTFGETYGMGVRVLVDGAWGFASTAIVDEAHVRETTSLALATARAATRLSKRKVELAAAPRSEGRWETQKKIDPFAVPLAEKAQFLLDLWPRVKDVAKVKYASGWIEAMSEEKTFASTDGTRVEQHQTRLWPGITVTATDKSRFETRSSEIAPMQAGWEYVTGSTLAKDAGEIARDAAIKLEAPSVKPGKRDLVLAPSNLWLTIHESVGHPTELDRALGLEANFAGTSFATPDKLGKLRYGSDLVTIYADKTVPGGLASCGWDDDGVATQRWDLVKDGIFVGYQTTRDQAAWIGEKSSRGTSYAQDHASVAFQRMPNVSLAPKDAGTVAQLVSETDDGVLITGNGSWSIDHQRYNFQFSGQMFYEIKGGKIAGPLKDVAYQSNSIEFWNACDRVGSREAWELHGTLWDGKGEPGQANAVSHGCPPARFRKIEILNVDKRGKS